MKNTLLLLLFILTTPLISAQDFDKLMQKKAPVCEDIAYNSTQYFIKYVQEGKLDSAHLILNYWEANCGINEPLFRGRILLTIKEGIFSDALIDSSFYDYLAQYENRMKIEDSFSSYEYYKIYLSYVRPKDFYDNSLKQLASELKPQTEVNSLEYHLCGFYAGDFDSIYIAMKNRELKNPELVSEYHEKTSELTKKPDFHSEFLIGTWIPDAGLSGLGMHSTLGMKFGGRSGIIGYDLSMILRMNKMKDSIWVINQGELKKTNYYLGGYIGADFWVELFRIGNSELDLVAGLGYDGFDAVKTNTVDENPDNDEGTSIGCLNLNGGLGYRYNLKNHSYIGLELKYNRLNYNNPGGTTLDGNALSLHLSFGGFTNFIKYNKLERLRYF